MKLPKSLEVKRDLPDANGHINSPYYKQGFSEGALAVLNSKELKGLVEELETAIFSGASLDALRALKTWQQYLEGE